jgi:hypothetical protein
MGWRHPIRREGKPEGDRTASRDPRAGARERRGLVRPVFTLVLAHAFGESRDDWPSHRPGYLWRPPRGAIDMADRNGIQDQKDEADRVRPVARARPTDGRSRGARRASDAGDDASRARAPNGHRAAHPFEHRERAIDARSRARREVGARAQAAPRGAALAELGSRSRSKEGRLAIQRRHPSRHGWRAIERRENDVDRLAHD